ncbi:hypothetical protein F442_10310, partial [Phytophthora nicotianae P10297]
MFYADTKTYDFANMIPHICLTPGGVSATAVAADDSACLNLVDEMKEFVDKMVEETDNGATQIWDEVYNKFYLESNRLETLKLLKMAKIYSLLESPKMSKAKNDVVSFFQFSYTWHNDTKAKQGKPSFERLLGWARPELRNLLQYDSVHLFVDGTFRSASTGFYQFTTLMMYDPFTELFVPKKIYPNPKDVVCDFEAALIFAVRDLLLSTRIIGCLFHFMQACRRKMKK